MHWTPAESLLWETARVVGAILRGEQLHGLPPSFALSLSTGSQEHLLTTAPFGRRWYGAIGDGSYQKTTMFVGGFSPLGVMLGAATLGASAANNARRRSEAASAAGLGWRDFDGGLVHVSDCGFYFDTAGKLLAFGFNCVQRMDLVGPGSVQFSAEMANGGVEAFIVTSDAAELMFVLWCLLRCDTHPQFRGGTWLPKAFLDRVRYAGLMGSLGGGSLGIGGG